MDDWARTFHDQSERRQRRARRRSLVNAVAILGGIALVVMLALWALNV